MAKQIVKVQLPLFSSDGSSPALVYNEDKTFMQELPLRSRGEMNALKRTLGDEMKGYFFAEFDGKGGLILKGIAPWQDW